MKFSKIIFMCAILMLQSGFAHAQVLMETPEQIAQEQVDRFESGGDTDQKFEFSEPSDFLQTDSDLDLSKNSEILDTAGSLGPAELQKFVLSKTKGTGQWAAQFIFVDKKGKRTVLSSLNANTSIKPASTLKIFTGYLAFLEKSYPVEDISTLLHKSDNVMADAALRSVAEKKGVQADGENKQKVLLNAGVEIMKKYYKNLEDSSKFHPVNGSGLNTTGVDEGEALNKATVRIETHLLEKIIKDKNYNSFKKLLAQPEQHGTLEGKLTEVSKLGQVYAKTGTLAKTKALAGYVETTNGILIFAIIADQLKIKPINASRVIEQVLLKHTEAAVDLK